MSHHDDQKKKNCVFPHTYDLFIIPLLVFPVIRFVMTRYLGLLMAQAFDKKGSITVAYAVKS